MSSTAVVAFRSMAEWVGEIRFSAEVAEKLRNKHGLAPGRVRQAVSCGAHERAAWHIHPVYGRRLVLTGRDADGAIIAYLRPLDQTDGLWECLTAWRMD